MSDIFDEIQKLGVYKRREQILARRHKEATAKRALQERHVKHVMNDLGFEEGDSIKYKGLRYSPEETIFARIQDKAALVEELKKMDPTLVEVKLNKAELNRIAREHVDNGQKLPEGLSYEVKEWVGITGIAGKVNQAQEDEHDDTE